LSDRLDNVRDMKSMNQEFRVKVKKETIYILDGLTGRELSRTHKILIKQIRKVLNKVK